MKPSAGSQPPAPPPQPSNDLPSQPSQSADINALSSIYPTPTQHQNVISSDLEREPLPKKSRFNKILLICTAIFVIFPLILSVVLFSSATGRGNDNAGWAAIYFFGNAIFAGLLIISIWIIHRLSQHSKQKPTVTTLNDQGDDYYEDIRMNFFFKMGLVLFGLTLIGIVSTILSIRNMTLTSGLPAWYPLFELFVAPLINLVGIGGAIWGAVSLRKSARNKKLYLGIVLCLSPLLMWIAISQAIAKKPSIINSKASNQGGGIESLSFTPYLPPPSSDYSLSPDTKPQIVDNSDSSIKIVEFKLLYKHQKDTGLDINEIKVDPSFAIGKDSTKCYSGGSLAYSVDCKYVFTTNNGTVVLNDSTTPVTSDSTTFYYFQKGQAYCYFALAPGATGGVSDVQSFIDTLQPKKIHSL